MSRNRCVPIALLALLLSGAARAATLEQIAAAHYHADWADQPVEATLLGVHDGDTRLDDLSEAAIARQAARLHAEQARLAALDPDRLTPVQRDDRDVLVAAINRELLDDEVIRPTRHDPDSYVSLASNAVYNLIERDFAPFPVRMRAVIAREQAIPAMLALADTQLADVPPEFVQIARADLDGARDVIGHDVPAVFASVSDPVLRAQLTRSTAADLAALDRYGAMLDRLHPTGSFVLGRQTMQALLAAEMVSLPVDQVVAAGRAQLAKDRSAFLAAEAEIDKANPGDSLALVRRDHPTAETLLATARDQLHALQRFVVSHRIVTLPSMTLPVVQDTPPFARAIFTAYSDWPGPFETSKRPGALTSYYDITPPDAAATPARREQQLADFNRPALAIVTAHEAMPGHFVQGLTLRAHPEWSLIRKATDSYATREGWAVYEEQMMVDQGLGDGDPRMRLVQLDWALLRDCRLLAAFGMHAQGMTPAQATSMMQTECFQSPAAAAKEARRGTEDPGYFGYDLGKLMILHLRDDLQRQQGAAFSLTRFHDRLLGAGLVPLPVIRRELTGHDGPML